MVVEEIKKYTFSGHDSFQCRQLWLKKGFDYVQRGYSFNDDEAVVRLGVGKNMVSAIRYWMKAFNILDQDDELTNFGIGLFDSFDGCDPYLEDEGSLWFLHYQLVKNGYASTYNIIFNDFRKEKISFTKETFVNYLKRRKEVESGFHFSDNTIADDFTVFVKMYQHSINEKDVEDSFSGILSELEILKAIGKGKDEQYQVVNTERDSLPASVLLYSILDNSGYGDSISLNALEYESNSPGSIFALNRVGLLQKISEITAEYDDIVFTDHAGVKELQFKKKPTLTSVFEKYYDK